MIPITPRNCSGYLEPLYTVSDLLKAFAQTHLTNHRHHHTASCRLQHPTSSHSSAATVSIKPNIYDWARPHNRNQMPMPNIARRRQLSIDMQVFRARKKCEILLKELWRWSCELRIESDNLELVPLCIVVDSLMSKVVSGILSQHSRCLNRSR